MEEVKEEMDENYELGQKFHFELRSSLWAVKEKLDMPSSDDEEDEEEHEEEDEEEEQSEEEQEKKLPIKREWVGETVLRKEKDLWGKDWYPGRVVNWNEVTNKHNVVFEKTADWEEFDEWVNLDKASPATLRTVVRYGSREDRERTRRRFDAEDDEEDEEEQS